MSRFRVISQRRDEDGALVSETIVGPGVTIYRERTHPWGGWHERIVPDDPKLGIDGEARGACR